MNSTGSRNFLPVDITEADVVAAMQAIPGYLDITPGDFREIYQAAITLAMQRILTTLKAENLMTRPVLSVEEGMGLVAAAALLAGKRISGAPVVGRDGVIVGVVSEKDFMKEMGMGDQPTFLQVASHCLTSKGCMVGNLHSKTIGSIMTRPALTGDPEMTIGDIATLFAERKINRLPIVDADGRPVGIVTRTDLAETYSLFGKRQGL